MVIKGIMAATAMVVVAVAAGQAQAGGFALREQSAYNQGWSFAGAAAGGPGISGMFWNPALVTNAKTITFDSNYSLVAPYAEMEPDDGFVAGFTPPIVGAPFVPLGGSGGSGDAGQDAIVPATYAAMPIYGDRVFAGVSINAPYGLATKPEPGWAGNLDSYSSKVFTVNVAPTIGVQLNDWIALGVGLQLEYFDVRLKNQTPLGLLTLDGDDNLAVGFTAGIQLKPWDGTEIGLGYRSSIEHEIKGDQTLGGASFAFETELDTPELVSLGVRQRVNDRLIVAGTIEWQNWSRLGTLNATGVGIPVTELPFEYEDGWFFSVGAEYQWSPELAVRAGVGYELSPIDDDVRTTRLPDDDRVWLSAGLTYNWSEKISIDAGYSFLFGLGDTPVVTEAAFAPIESFRGESDNYAHIVSVGLRYKFGSDPEPVFLKDKIAY